MLGYQGTGVTVTAIVMKPCQCGHAFGHHVCRCGCEAYVATEPPINLGTRAYRPRPGLRLLARVTCMTAWAVERRLQGWREHLEREG